MLELLRCVLFTILLFSFINPGYGQLADNDGAKLSTIVEDAKATTTTSSTKVTSVAITPTFGNGTCPSRTANYITHTLPQQCLRTDRTTSTVNATANGDASTGSLSEPVAATTISSGVVDSTASASESAVPQPSTGDASTSATSVSISTASGSTSVIETVEESDSPLDNANFLSFEEWKKQNLAKLEADQARNPPLNGDRQRPGINNALEALGDEGEIDLDFSGFGQPASGPSQPRAAYRHPDASSPSEVAKSQTLRSKDAGKTCKERTNYASFDCAAQVLKHNPECKSPYSILVENKDSYMLNTCSASNKFFIVELCNDLWIDTIVLANYEFFSSIFRHFRVSVSDRYPVKMDKWVELGTFEAKNTREIQAFLVEHPQIWARYVRIEILSHYGSEYYCPVSLLRVHGINMLEEFRSQDETPQIDGSESEAARELESEASSVLSPALIPTSELEKGSTGQREIPVSSAPQVVTSDIQCASHTESTETTVPSVMPSQDGASQNNSIITPTIPGPDLSNMTCSTSITSETTESSSLSSDQPPSTTQESQDSTATALSQAKLGARSEVVAGNTTLSDSSSSGVIITTTAASSASNEKAMNMTSVQKSLEDKPLSLAQPVNTTSASPSTDAGQTGSSTNSSRTISATASSSVPPPQPSTQDSFFKSLSKRLQQLESNSTLSLQYIEEQSRILRDAFSKVEKRQISSTTNFLTNLNETVIKELHGFRQAYDQLWQSTVLELEGQRDQYQREMLVLSSRLTLVADELLWQKRMGIAQSGLLLLCLGLVLFARTGLQGHLEVPLMQHMMNKSSAALSRAAWESPPQSPSPENRSPVTLFRRKLWRSATEPERVASGHGTDGDITGTDSRPDTRDGPNVDIFVEEPTPPPSRGTDSGSSAMYDDADADDEDEEVMDPRESQSGPSTPTGTRDIIDRSSDMANGVIDHGVG